MDITFQAAAATLTLTHASIVVVAGFKGDIFGTAKERGEQYRREAEAQAQRDAARQRGTA